MKNIYFAGGCFWGTQKYFDQFDGVIRTEVGYANGPDMLDTIQKAYKEEEALIGQALAVEVKPLANFFTAEEYHQKYLDKNPGGYCHIPAEFFTIAKQ